MGKDINNEREIKFRAKAINDDFFQRRMGVWLLYERIMERQSFGRDNRRSLSIPMQVVGLLSSFNNPSPEDTVYLDFEGNEGDVWEEEVQNLVFSDNEDKP